MILGCLILVMIVVASSNKAESVAGLNEPEDDGRRSRGTLFPEDRTFIVLSWFK